MDILAQRRLRPRGPAPKLADRAVITLEIVGEYLSLHQDQALFTSFRRHDLHFFPALRPRHRTPFVRQAAHLCDLQARIGQRLRAPIRLDPSLPRVDRLPLPVGPCARAYRGPRFRGEGAFGDDVRRRQPCFGFRVHVRVAGPGVIVRFNLAPAAGHETAVVPEWVEGRQGTVVGDRHYGSPPLPEALAPQGLPRRAPFKQAQPDPGPKRSALLSRFRYRRDTVCGPRGDRYLLQRVWARDRWPLGHRLLRKALSHTLACRLNQAQGHPPLQISKWVT